jgi:DNA-binding Lrp family transcriptional regulator
MPRDDSFLEAWLQGLAGSWQPEAGRRKLFSMITAIVLVRAARDRNPETAEALAAMKFVSECYSVTGDWDIVVILRFPHFEDLDEIVTGHLRKIPGIERTSTMLAFKAFSKELLDQAFNIGLEG